MHDTPNVLVKPANPKAQATQPSHQRRETDFVPSKALTVGVEMELQILDPDTGHLVPRANELIGKLSAANFKYEFYLTDIEINTGICDNVQAAGQDLTASIATVISLGKNRNLQFASTGCHPFTHHSHCPITPVGHYQATITRHPWIINRQMVYALQVHLGMQSGNDCIRTMNQFSVISPHLLALSGSSPFWEGEDTGLASFRPLTYEILPTAGLPYGMQCWQDYVDIVSILKQSDAITDVRDLWWDMRPNPQLGTLEIRVCDGLATLSETLAITALIHCFADWFHAHPERLIMGPSAHWMLRENKWRAIRDGLDANIILSLTAGLKPLRQDIEDWLTTLTPYFKRRGYMPYLKTLYLILEKGTSAQRQRRVFKETQSLEAVVQHNIWEFEKGSPIW